MSKPVAILHRMVLPDHTCPFGLKALDLLKRKGYAVEDHLLRTRAEVDAFKAEHGVTTTPQAFIDGKRIGGYSELRAFFGHPVADPKALSYRPVIVIFAMAALMALAASWAVQGALLTQLAAEWFVAFTVAILALVKLQNVEKFSSMFLGYDLLAQRWVPYASLYPYLEALAAILMIAGILPLLSGPLMLFIGGIGAVSVFKAVYIDKRTLKCACVGGDSNVPLGFVSLTENLFMIGMGLWMLVRHGLMG